ncbi:hypothetical protein SAMN05216262_101206 [Colwellia chukchiensis]|uniref:Uncharacterized protein n=2 Tax=Colwellia chukchiensis TaxID=641665 RepID=A0A1H7GLJ4_9GAMM|nr:hypothetical protein SAMN05216262_101206 [Colwellia chukchiensis]
MKLIMRTEFDNLRLNPLHDIESDVNGDKQVVKIFRNQQLISKRVILKKSIRYFAIKGYQQYLTEE